MEYIVRVLQRLTDCRLRLSNFFSMRSNDLARQPYK